MYSNSSSQIASQTRTMRTPWQLALLPWVCAILLITGGCGGQSGTLQHPPAVATGALPGFSPVPADALVLFDGTSMDAWQKKGGKPARWKLKAGYMEVRRWTESIYSKAAFGDMQMHVEWATPAKGIGRGQHKGNSGIKLMGLYEIQILDSYENKTYPEGQAGAIYSQHPPLVNASRPSGAWQAFDIIFRRPRFDPSGELISPAYLTVFHNGVLIHDHVALAGPTANKKGYVPHPDHLPVMLQNHRSKVRFRNIWVRTLE